MTERRRRYRSSSPTTPKDRPTARSSSDNSRSTETVLDAARPGATRATAADGQHRASGGRTRRSSSCTRSAAPCKPASHPPDRRRPPPAFPPDPTASPRPTRRCDRRRREVKSRPDHRSGGRISQVDRIPIGSARIARVDRGEHVVGDPSMLAYTCCTSSWSSKRRQAAARPARLDGVSSTVEVANMVRSDDSTVIQTSSMPVRTAAVRLRLAGDLPVLAVTGHVVGAGVDGRHHHLVLVDRAGHDDDPLALELPRPAPGSAIEPPCWRRSSAPRGRCGCGCRSDPRVDRRRAVRSPRGDLLVGDALGSPGPP